MKDVAVVMHLHEFAPVGRRAASRRKRRRLERLAKMHENLADGPWLGDEGDEPNVAAAGKGTEVETPPRLWPLNSPIFLLP